MKYLLCAFLMLNVIACTKESKTEVVSGADSPVSKDSVRLVPKKETLSKEQVLKNLNKEIIQTLKEKNYPTFSRYIHPEKGITFSMYSHLNSKKDKHFTRETFDTYISKETKFTWGEQDGTGDLLVLSLKDYFHEWLFKRDYTTSDYFLNEFKGTGNTLNNMREMYPKADFTENYIEGLEIYGGLDWNSLIFVFEEFEGKFYLVAAANNSWTT